MVGNEVGSKDVGATQPVIAIKTFEDWEVIGLPVRAVPSHHLPSWLPINQTMHSQRLDWLDANCTRFHRPLSRYGMVKSVHKRVGEYGVECDVKN